MFFSFFSHIHHQKPPELLKDHKKLTQKYLDKILQKVDLDRVIDSLGIEDKELVKQMIIDAVVMHDEGKRNPNFQYYIMKNKDFKDLVTDKGDTKHSYLSAKIFFEKYFDKVDKEVDDNEFYKKFYFLLGLSYVISKHHSKLGEFEKFVDDFSDEFDLKGILQYQSVDIYFGIEFYVVMKLIYSILISADYYATLEYMAEIEVDNFGEFREKEKFYEYEVIKNMDKFEGELNKIRREMYKKSEEKLLQNLDKNIFYLNAPTGAGKTLMSMNLALQFEPKKIFYVFPFNTLVEQTAGVFKEIFDDVVVINSTTPIEFDESDIRQYEIAYLNRAFYHYPFILTTHVNFFELLFGVGKEENFPFWQLAGSVVILDEIQSYNVDKWWYMVKMLNVYSKIIGFKLIIMSATLPRLDRLLNEKRFVDLLGSGYLKHPVFKDRVEVDFSLLDKEINFEDIEEVILSENKQKVLVEFIKKDRAKEFYEYMKDTDGYEVYLLTGDDNKLYREKVIKRCKSEARILLISTQVIEAGVDIDMDLGLKDISLLESEEQFIGRVNRNAKKNSKVYFFDMDKEADIYRGDIRLGFSIKSYKEVFLRKEYEKYYIDVLDALKKEKEKIKSTKSEIEIFKSKVINLDFEWVRKEMKLINVKTHTIFLSFNIDISEFDIEVKDEFLTDGMLDGCKVWEAYKEANEIENYAKRKIVLSQVMSLMQFFTFNVYSYVDIKKYNDLVGGIYLIKDYEEFVDDELKFDRKAFGEYQKGIFL
ncbi:CRISPR-associated helicase Cas3' [Caminibacter pacificus]|uniref:CRISPR-associated Cas3 family helicase n=1 Tax=Caminibacter pacificus TaxID=1424653 RepID=A0AAJ4RE60_9BACT|nr:CRISPR-associated helicase Cas3' [Caminibacter pacificus]QCI28217.1 CRISPR-associated helicase Cas3' [Caminibacter pacificus]ROR41070.1 CRISPR-associated Cas3 family helicase [Caminibacter pacificus]